MTPCIEAEVGELEEDHIYKIYDINRDDLSHLIPEQETQSSNETHDYLSEIYWLTLTTFYLTNGKISSSRHADDSLTSSLPGQGNIMVIMGKLIIL